VYVNRSPRSTPVIQDEGTDAETCRQIARESDKIRREMERERRAKSMSPGRECSPTRTYLTLTQSPKVCLCEYLCFTCMSE
jgi:hypothetical protein